MTITKKAENIANKLLEHYLHEHLATMTKVPPQEEITKYFLMELQQQFSALTHDELIAWYQEQELPTKLMNKTPPKTTLILGLTYIHTYQILTAFKQLFPLIQLGLTLNQLKPKQ